MIGRWEGDKGIEVAPDPDGREENPYYETITFEGVGNVENAESQRLVAVHYRQIVRRKSDREVFHDETGYWKGFAYGSVGGDEGCGITAGISHQLSPRGEWAATIGNR